MITTFVVAIFSCSKDNLALEPVIQDREYPISLEVQFPKADELNNKPNFDIKLLEITMNIEIPILDLNALKNLKLKNGSYQLTIKAEGYEPFVKDFVVEDKGLNFDIELARYYANTKLNLKVTYPKEGTIFFDMKSKDKVRLKVYQSSDRKLVEERVIEEPKDIDLVLKNGTYDIELGSGVYIDYKKAIRIKDKEQTLKFDLQNRYISNTWLISELHVAWGRADKVKWAFFEDGYMEFYNNSDKTLYADGLCFSRVYALLNEDYNIFDDVVGACVPFYIWQVPGNGTDYPVKPGGKILIPINAQNNLIRENIWSGYDLSMGNFEFYRKENEGFHSLDNPNVPNMKLIHCENGEYFPMHFSFEECYFIFKPKEGQTIEDYLKSKRVKRTEKNGELVESYAIPNIDILDMVNHTSFYSSKTSYKVAPPVLERGNSYVLHYDSDRVAKRKVLMTTKDGRKILQDTNNSTEDFNNHTLSSYVTIF